MHFETKRQRWAKKELNAKLHVSKVYFKIERGEQTKDIESREQLEMGEAFVRKEIVREVAPYIMTMEPSSSVRYDLVGKIVGETGLTRKAVTKVLVGIDIFI